MTDLVEFELVSPQRLVKSQTVGMVVVPCAEGDIGVLAGHTPLIGTVRPGVVDIHEDDRCTLLAEEATLVSDLKAEDAQSRLDAANTALAKADGDAEKRNLEAEISIAEAMLAVLGGASAH